MTDDLAMAHKDGSRVVSLPLMIGLVSAPLLFGWLLLRRGYAPSLRRVVCVYALMTPLLAALLMVLLVVGSLISSMLA